VGTGDRVRGGVLADAGRVRSTYVKCLAKFHAGGANRRDRRPGTVEEIGRGVYLRASPRLLSARGDDPAIGQGDSVVSDQVGKLAVGRDSRVGRGPGDVEAGNGEARLDVGAECSLAGDNRQTGWVNHCVVGPEVENALDVPPLGGEGCPLGIALQETLALGSGIHEISLLRRRPAGSLAPSCGGRRRGPAPPRPSAFQGPRADPRARRNTA